VDKVREKKKKRNGFMDWYLKGRDGLWVTDGVSVFLCLLNQVERYGHFFFFGFSGVFSAGSLFSLHCPIIC